MGASVEEKVLSLKLRHEQFKQGVSESLKSLQRLSKGLRIPHAAEGLKNLQDSVRKIDFSPIDQGIAQVQQRFLNLSNVATVALGNITAQAAISGAKMLSSFVFQPLTDGFAEYENKLNSVQTILANTQHKGENIESVTAVLNDLNKYSDKTIYNFGEMTRNIGTFTAAGVGLQESKSAIKGIANLAALSGSSSQQAASGMYQLSQAISAGTVRAMDWNSVTNAGLGGEVFQEALKRTARNHGIAVDELIAKNGSFKESLQEGWLSSEVLLETLAQLTGDLSKEQLINMGYTAEQADEIANLAKTANDAATKVKTFSQLLGTIREAIGSGWAESFELIFGNFEEAREIWTSVSDVIGGAIQRSSNARNAMLKAWKDAGGRTAILQGIHNVLMAIWKPLKVVAELINELFQGPDGKQLASASKAFEGFTSYLVMSDETMQMFKDTLRIVVEPLKVLLAIVKMAAKVAFPALIIPLKIAYAVFRILANVVLLFTSLLGRIVKAVREWVASWRIFNMSGEKAVSVYRAVANAIDSLPDKLFALAGAAKNTLNSLSTKALDKMQKAWEGVVKAFKATPVAAAMRNTLSVLRSTNEQVAAIGRSVAQQMKTFVKSFDIQKLPTLDELKTQLQTLFSGLAETVKDVPSLWRQASGSVINTLRQTRDALVAYTGLDKIDLKSWLDVASMKQWGKDLASALVDVETYRKILHKLQEIVAANIPKAAVDALKNLARHTVEALKSFWASIASMDEAAAKFGETVANVAGKVKSNISTLASGASKLFNGIIAAVHGFLDGLGLIDGLQHLFGETLPNVFNKAIAGVTSVLSTISKAIGTLFTGIKQDLGNFAGDIPPIDWTTVLAGVGGGGLVAVLMKKFKGLGSIRGVLKSVMNAIDNFGGVLESLAGSIDASARLIKAEALKSMATGIAILAGSLVLLTFVDPISLGVAGTTLGILAAGIVKAMKSLDSVKMGPKAAVKVTGMIAFALALSLLSKAVARIAEVGAGGIVAGTASASILMYGMAKLMKTLAKVTNDADAETMIPSLMSLLGVSGAVYLLGKSVALLGEMELGTLAKGVTASGILLLALAKFSELTSNKLNIGNALSMLAVAQAITMVAKVIGNFAQMSWSDWLGGVIKASVVLGLLAGTILTFPESALRKAILVLATVSALQLAAAAIGVFALFSWSAFLNGATRMAATLAIIVTAMNMMNGSLKAALGLSLIAKSLLNLTVVIAAFSLLNPLGAALALTVLAGAMGVLVGAGYVAMNIMPGLITLALVIGTIGFAATAVATAITAMSVAIAAMTGAGTALGAAVVAVLAAVAVTIPLFVEGIMLGFQTMLEYVGSMQEPMTNAITAIFLALIQSARDILPELGVLVLEILNLVMNTIIEFAPQFADGAFTLLTSMLNVFASRVGEFADAATNAIVSFLDAVGRNLPRILKAGADFIINFVNGLANTIRNEGPRMMSAAANLGKAIVEGLWNGIKDMVSWVTDKIWSFGEDVLGGIADFFGIFSPSRETRKLGRWISIGLGLGIEDEAHHPVEAAEKASKASMDAMRHAFENSDWDKVVGDSRPTIRPVLDMTEVERDYAAFKLGGPALSLTSSISTVHGISGRMAPVPVRQNGSETAPSTVTTGPTFIQNNYSPKALSAADLYVQTRRQLTHTGGYNAQRV